MEFLEGRVPARPKLADVGDYDDGEGIWTAPLVIGVRFIGCFRSATRAALEQLPSHHVEH